MAYAQGNEICYECASHHAASYQRLAVLGNPPCSWPEQSKRSDVNPIPGGPGWPKAVPKPKRAGESYTQIPQSGRDIALVTVAGGVLKHACPLCPCKCFLSLRRSPRQLFDAAVKSTRWGS